MRAKGAPATTLAGTPTSTSASSALCTTTGSAAVPETPMRASSAVMLSASDAPVMRQSKAWLPSPTGPVHAQAIVPVSSVKVTASTPPGSISTTFAKASSTVTTTPTSLPAMVARAAGSTTTLEAAAGSTTTALEVPARPRSSVTVTVSLPARRSHAVQNATPSIVSGQEERGSSPPRASPSVSGAACSSMWLPQASTASTATSTGVTPAWTSLPGAAVTRYPAWSPATTSKASDATSPEVLKSVMWFSAQAVSSTTSTFASPTRSTIVRSPSQSSLSDTRAAASGRRLPNSSRRAMWMVNGTCASARKGENGSVTSSSLSDPVCQLRSRLASSTPSSPTARAVKSTSSANVDRTSTVPSPSGPREPRMPAPPAKASWCPSWASANSMPAASVGDSASTSTTMSVATSESSGASTDRSSVANSPSSHEARVTENARWSARVTVTR